MMCQRFSHWYDGRRFDECPACEHLQGEWDDECRMETQNECAHENTIDVGDTEHTVIACTDCETTLNAL